MVRSHSIRQARPGEEDLRYFCSKIHKRLHTDWDLVMGVCGEEGCGKSTLAVIMGWYLNPEFTVKRNVIASPEAQEVADSLLGKLPRYSTVILDEAIKVLYKLGWQNQAQILLNTVFSICRAQNKAVILCMPKFTDFNAYQRQHRVKVWIEVVERGHAFVFMKDRSPFVQDSWHLKENQKAIEKAVGRRSLSDMSKEDFYEALRRAKTYAGEFHFGLMPEEHEKAYNALKKEVSASFDLEDAKGITRLYRNATKQAIKILYTELEMKQDELSGALGISICTVNRFLKDLNVRPSDKKMRSKTPRIRV